MLFDQHRRALNVGRRLTISISGSMAEWRGYVGYTESSPAGMKRDSPELQERRWPGWKRKPWSIRHVVASLLFGDCCCDRDVTIQAERDLIDSGKRR